MADEIRQIKIRRDASTVWASVNPILAAGELAFDTTLRRLKVGDGSNAWSALPWSSMDASEVARLEAAADALDGAATPYDAATATVLGMQNGAARKVLTDTIGAEVATAPLNKGTTITLDADATGAADSSAAFRAVRNHVGTVIVPPGIYRFDNSSVANAVILGSNIRFYAPRGATIRLTNLLGPAFLAYEKSNIEFDGLTVEANGTWAGASQTLTATRSTVRAALGTTNTITQPDVEYNMIFQMHVCDGVSFRNCNFKAQTPGRGKSVFGWLYLVGRNSDWAKARNMLIENCAIDDAVMGVIPRIFDGLTLSRIKMNRFDQYGANASGQGDIGPGHLLYAHPSSGTLAAHMSRNLVLDNVDAMDAVDVGSDRTMLDGVSQQPYLHILKIQGVDGVKISNFRATGPGYLDFADCRDVDVMNSTFLAPAAITASAGGWVRVLDSTVFQGPYNFSNVILRGAVGNGPSSVIQAVPTPACQVNGEITCFLDKNGATAGAVALLKLNQSAFRLRYFLSGSWAAERPILDSRGGSNSTIILDNAGGNVSDRVVRSGSHVGVKIRVLGSPGNAASQSVPLPTSTTEPQIVSDVFGAAQQSAYIGNKSGVVTKTLQLPSTGVYLVTYTYLHGRSEMAKTFLVHYSAKQRAAQQIGATNYAFEVEAIDNMTAAVDSGGLLTITTALGVTAQSSDALSILKIGTA